MAKTRNKKREARQQKRRQARRNTTEQPAASMQIKPPESSPYQNKTPANMSHSQYGANISRLQEFNQGGTGVGAAAVQRAREAGMSDQDIRNAVFYGRYNVGEAAFNELFGGGQRASNTMGGRVLRNPDATVANVSGYGTQNWNTDTLAHMQERRQAFENVGQNLAQMQGVVNTQNWQPANSFAELGDQRWYSQPVTNQMRIMAADAVARSGRYTPRRTVNPLSDLLISNINL